MISMVDKIYGTCIKWMNVPSDKMIVKAVLSFLDPSSIGTGAGSDPLDFILIKVKYKLKLCSVEESHCNTTEVLKQKQIKRNMIMITFF